MLQTKRLTLLLLPLMMMACGGDDDNITAEQPQPTPPPQPTVTIALESQSISNGAEVAATATTALVLTYNIPAKVTDSDGVTLNGTKTAVTSKPGEPNSVEIALQLQDDTDYVLQMAEGVVVAAADASVKAPALTLTFKTVVHEAPPTEPTNKDISTTPLTASTPAALKLYDYFYQQYGRKTISSVMANVNWNNDCADKVYKLTGKYPAMNCYDFIHVCFSPANWIDYTTIAPVQSWVKADGLVQLMWHFNVPKKQGSTDYTCTPSETTFRAKNVFTAGSWENKWFYSQMDKVVATMLKLQEAGIAATWRPFHEAAGNATARQQASWTKSWFWWGYDGAETYKRLWVTMFDYFRQKGVNNLIWIWTTQNYNGNSTLYQQDTDWYPGDQYVDMVARDLYGYNATKNKQEFTQIQSCYPNKMVVLGECGRDGNSNTEAARPGEFWTGGALWGHFMVWYQGGQGSTDTMCSDAWWKAAMSNPNVITRDQVPKLWD